MDSNSLKGSRKSLNKSNPELQGNMAEGEHKFDQDSVKINVNEDGMESIEMNSMHEAGDERPASKVESEKAKSIDYNNRDPNNIHEDVKVNFADIIAEPSGAHSFMTVWGTSYKVYSVTKYWIYRIMSLVFGVPTALFWGIYFSCLAFCSVWCITPCIRSFMIKIGFLGKIWGACVNTVLDPFFMSIGLVLSRIRVALTVNRQD